MESKHPVCALDVISENRRRTASPYIRALCPTQLKVVAPSNWSLFFAHLFGCLGFVVTAEDDAHARPLHDLNYVVVIGHSPEEEGNETEDLAQNKLHQVPARQNQARNKCTATGEHLAHFFASLTTSCTIEQAYIVTGLSSSVIKNNNKTTQQVSPTNTKNAT